MAKKTIMQVANLESFRLAKETLDTKIRAAVDEFINATPDCKLVDIEIWMNGDENGILYENDGTIDKIRVLIEVV